MLATIGVPPLARIVTQMRQRHMHPRAYALRVIVSFRACNAYVAFQLEAAVSYDLWATSGSNVTESRELTPTAGSDKAPPDHARPSVEGVSAVRVAPWSRFGHT